MAKKQVENEVVATPEWLAPGRYVTDGSSLLEVLFIEDDVVHLEDAAHDATDLQTSWKVALSDALATMRPVEPARG